MLYNFEDLSFQILTVDRFPHKDGFVRVEPRYYAALSYRVRGSGVFKIGDKHFTVGEGDVLFIPADVAYEVEYSASESIVANLPECNYTEPELFGFKNPAEGAIMFSELLDVWQKNHSVNQTKSMIYAILDKIDSAQRTSDESSAFALCLEYIDEHFCESELDVTEVCKVGFISRSSLQREFFRRYGISPKQYVIKLRMNKALRLLIENRLPVREVAASCGFADEKYFSRSFKRHYGTSPSDMRRLMLV